MSMLRLTEDMRVKTTRGGRMSESNRVVLRVAVQHLAYRDSASVVVYVYKAASFHQRDGVWIQVPVSERLHLSDVSPAFVADVLEGLCDAFAAYNNMPYHIENPERLETLRAGRWTKVPRREKEGA